MIPHEVYRRGADTLGGAAIVVQCYPKGVPLFYEFQSPIDAAAFVMRLDKGRIDLSGLRSGRHV